MERIVSSVLDLELHCTERKAVRGWPQRTAVCGLQKHGGMSFLHLEVRHGLLCSRGCFLLGSRTATVAVCSSCSQKVSE